MIQNLPILLLIYGDWVTFALRVVLGLILVVHGWPKMRDLAGTAEKFATLGFRPGRLWAPVMALLEFIGGPLLILGIFVRPVAALVLGQFLVVIIWRLFRREKFVGAFEYDLLLFVSTAVLVAQGAGAFTFRDLWLWIFS